ncbi:MAG: RNA 3'-terminal phosphate cyclase [Candidatus Aenigmarchaeota archaeon]|nr:RNA 3'-terminal phosphate cyclase [Candidatus Aenigmarchaeota archaeon]
MIIIDGSQGEGGGQVLRTATSLAVVLGKPCKITRIRANRPKPGLKEQHMQGLLALADLCNGRVENAFIGSGEIEFYPGDSFEKEIEINIKTAGAVTLVLQSLAIAAAFTENDVRIKINGGATNTAWSPPIDYTRNVFFPLLGKMGYEAAMEIIRRGFYPKGGAEVECVFKPAKNLGNLQIEKCGDVKIINGLSLCANLPKSVAERQKKSAEIILDGAGYETEIQTEAVDSSSPGSALVLYAECENSIIGADALGEIKKSSENVGKEAAEKMISRLKSGFSLDPHAADQVIPYIALGKGESVITTQEITQHTLTNINICEKLLGVKFSVGKNKISVDGLFRSDRNV